MDTILRLGFSPSGFHFGLISEGFFPTGHGFWLIDSHLFFEVNFLLDFFSLGLSFGEDLAELFWFLARFGFWLSCFSCLFWGFLSGFGFGENLINNTLFVLLGNRGGLFFCAGFLGFLAQSIGELLLFQDSVLFLGLFPSCFYFCLMREGFLPVGQGLFFVDDNLFLKVNFLLGFFLLLVPSGEACDFSVGGFSPDSPLFGLVIGDHLVDFPLPVFQGR